MKIYPYLTPKPLNMTPRILFLFTIILYCTNSVNAQVKIGNNPTTVNVNSILELESAGKGLLLPRSTTADIHGMTAVPTGMLLFNTTDSSLYLKRDTGWVIMPSPSSQSAVTPTYADFYALMPGDNSATVAVGTPVQFPQDGPASGTITRLTASTFNLQDIGTYQVLFQVSVSEPGQLVVALNGLELPYTVVGRATGTSQIMGMCIITTSSINSTIEIRNSTGSFIALTITPSAGGTNPVSAHLVITKLQ